MMVIRIPVRSFSGNAVNWKRRDRRRWGTRRRETIVIVGGQMEHRLVAMEANQLFFVSSSCVDQVRAIGCIQGPRGGRVSSIGGAGAGPRGRGCLVANGRRSGIVNKSGPRRLTAHSSDDSMGLMMNRLQGQCGAECSLMTTRSQGSHWPGRGGQIRAERWSAFQILGSSVRVVITGIVRIPVIMTRSLLLIGAGAKPMHQGHSIRGGAC